MSTQQDPSVAQFNRLRSEAERHLRNAELEEVTRALADTTNDVRQLPSDVEALRKRGYVFASYLEHKLGVLESRWEEARRDTQQALAQELDRLREEAHQVDVLVEKGNRVLSNPAALATVIPMLEREADGLDRAVQAALTRVKQYYSTVERDVESTLEQVRDINGYLDEADEASFDFLAGEQLFLAAEAEWKASGRGKDDPDGIVYLTDQRLIFEQKEKTGKKLGLFGGKMTQEMEWALPLHQIESVQAENKGLFGGKDLLHFTLGSGAPFAQTTLEVKGKARSKFWAAQIERMIQGKTQDERAIEPDSETLETLRNAPTSCHVCGATLPMLVANERQVECLYCGTVIRV